MEQQRDCTLDIAKAICICLMVIGHSGCPEYLHRFIYMFHMPCFFFISGWLLKDKYITDLKKGLFNKIKGSYYPFVKWSLIFLVFHNLLAGIHIYKDSYTLHEYLVKVIRIFTMTGSEQLLGGYWFLISLCWASLLSLFLLYVYNRRNVLTNISISGGVILNILIVCMGYSVLIKLPQQLREQTFLATAFYLSGYLFHKVGKFQNIPLIAGIVLLLVPACVALFVKWSMNDCKAWISIPYYAVALTGTLGVFSISTWLSKQKISSLFSYVGNKTLYILTFHFIAFKLVSWLYIYVKGLPIDYLTQFPVLRDSISYLWIMYSVLGIGIPLLIWELLHVRVFTFNFLKLNK